MSEGHVADDFVAIARRMKEIEKENQPSKKNFEDHQHDFGRTRWINGPPSLARERGYEQASGLS